jgi:predicted esterase
VSAYDGVAKIRAEPFEEIEIDLGGSGLKRVSQSLLLVLALLLPRAAAGAGKLEPVVCFPAKATGQVPVAIWLHGYRAFPSEMEDRAYYQGVADKLGVAIIGIPGTTMLEDGTPVWSEQPAADHAYIQDVLAGLPVAQKLDLQRVALFGFSQGAVVAADLAVRYPAAYRGAIIMSPGNLTGPKAEVTNPELNKKQTFFVLCGAKEHEGNVALTKDYADFLRKLTTHVTEREDPEQSKHTRPSDFRAQFPSWIAAILGLPAR